MPQGITKLGVAQMPHVHAQASNKERELQLPDRNGPKQNWEKCYTCGKLIAAEDQRVSFNDFHWHSPSACASLATSGKVSRITKNSGISFLYNVNGKQSLRVDVYGGPKHGAGFLVKRVHPTEIRTSISPSSAAELNTTSALANYTTEAAAFSITSVTISVSTGPETRRFVSISPDSDLASKSNTESVNIFRENSIAKLRPMPWLEPTWNNHLVLLYRGPRQQGYASAPPAVTTTNHSLSEEARHYEDSLSQNSDVKIVFGLESDKLSHIICGVSKALRTLPKVVRMVADIKGMQKLPEFIDTSEK
ncbi:unnamed protein product [Timema podura]|uniref:Uncharacterized protein n=1 Tax=Timema podura TaxID=61482 RepID=A0ABN7NQN1_TIMPD|nr:unnamed protein product [Timema podura]